MCLRLFSIVSSPCTTPHTTEPSQNQPTASSDDIQRQQADLQAKILSLLGSNAVVPSSSQSSQASQSGYDASRGVSYPQMGGPRQYEGYSGGGGGGGGGGYDAYGYGNYR